MTLSHGSLVLMVLMVHGLQFVIEAVPDHTHVLFYIYKSIKYSDLFSGKNSLKRPGLEEHWT